MARRVVLGCGAVGHTIVESLADEPVDLLVVDDNEDRVETLREENVASVHANPGDPATIADVGAPSVVLIASDDPTSNLDAARVARDNFPEVYLVAYTGYDPTDAIREELRSLVDRMIDYDDTLQGALLEVVTGQVGARLQSLKETLRSVDGRLGIFTHDNPDPDAIASGLALQQIAAVTGVSADVCYFGEIAHQENRAFVNLLDIDLRRLDPATFELAEYDALALVDHSRPGVNDQLPPETLIDIVIDHHPPREPVDATFIDLRSEAGATSTLLANYFREFRVEPNRTVATALLYGIRVDTNNFEREISDDDFGAAAFLLPLADVDILERVESPSVSGTTIDTVARSIRNRTRRESTVVSDVGRIADRDALAQAADQLLTIEDVDTTLVYGFMDGCVFASARTRGTDVDIGEAVRRAFGQIGSAGGHVDMAGAQIPLGILADIGADSNDPTEADDEAVSRIVSEVITNRFFEVLDL